MIDATLYCHFCDEPIVANQEPVEMEPGHAGTDFAHRACCEAAAESQHDRAVERLQEEPVLNRELRRSREWRKKWGEAH